MRIFLINCILIIAYSQSTAQTVITYSTPDSSSRINYFGTNYNNNINSINLSTRLNLDIKKGNARLFLSDVFLSDVTRLSTNYIRDNNSLKFASSYLISRTLYGGAGVNYTYVSDDRDIDLNKQKNIFGFANFDFAPLTFLNINAKAGLRSEDQIGERNSGPAGILTADFIKFNVQDFISDGRIMMSYDNLTNKTNYDYRLQTSINKKFSEKSDNTSFIRAYAVRNDFYTPATPSIQNTYNVRNNIQSRYESNVYLENNLKYTFTQALRFYIGGLYSIRNITNLYKYKPSQQNILFENIYDFKVIENLLRAEANLEYNVKSLKSKIIMLYTERSEEHSTMNTDNLTQAQKRDLDKQENAKNNSNKTTSLIADAVYDISNTNTLRFTGSSTVLRYDTDNDLNTDTRDELSLIGAISHRYDNKMNFDIETIFEINSATLNYLLKERSSNNNNNKIYKLSSKSTFYPAKQVMTRNVFQVLANYTVYKYEDLISKVQSFSFRQFYYSDTTFYNFLGNFFIDLSGSLRIYEQGFYNEKNFAEKPVAYYDERNIGLKLRYSLDRGVMISAGYKHFIKRQYKYILGDKYLDRTFASYGPIGELTLMLKNNSRINIILSRDYQEWSDNPIISGSSNIIVNINWNI